MSVPTAELTAPPAAVRQKALVVSLAGRLGGGRLYIALAVLAVVIAALSLLIPSTPSYDPWAWLVWGKEIIHVNLHTTGGPTWKPLPVIFTTIFALFGKAQPDLWLVVARAGSLMAVAMVFKIAMRITRELTAGEARTGDRRWLVPVLLAGLIAAASLVNSRGFVTDNALGYSEGLMTALVLVALDRHLDGARRQAFAVGFLAALDRPELWLFWGPYGLYLWWKDPGARKLVVILFAMIPVLWFLPEYWGSGHFLRGVSRAQHPRSNSPAFATCPFCTEFVKHAWPTVMFRVKLIAGLAMMAALIGLWRTRRSWLRHGFSAPSDRAKALLFLAGAAGFFWWVLIAVLTQAGFSGNDRYLVLGAALVAIAGGAGWGWAAHALARLLSKWRAPAALATAVAAIACALVLVFTPPWIGPSVIDVPATHRALVYQAHLRQDASEAVQKVGGPARILRCGTVMTEGFQVPLLAWNLGVHTLQVQASPVPDTPPPPAPNVIFQTRAQRNSTRLPLLRTWGNVHYQLVAHVRTFRVYSSCRGNLVL